MGSACGDICSRWSSSIWDFSIGTHGIFCWCPITWCSSSLRCCFCESSYRYWCYYSAAASSHCCPKINSSMIYRRSCCLIFSSLEVFPYYLRVVTHLYLLLSMYYSHITQHVLLFLFLGPDIISVISSLFPLSASLYH